MNELYLYSAARTPLGAFQGQFSPLAAHQLGAQAICAAVERAGLPPEALDELVMGCVLPAGQGQAPARQAALGAGLPVNLPCTTVNKVCGSGMKAIMLAGDAILAGHARAAVAGGMESMSNAPYLLPGARSGYRMGHREVQDHMFLDGLQNPYDGQLMGHFAEQCVRECHFNREQQDDWARQSALRSQRAVAEGRFQAEITPVEVRKRKDKLLIRQDEEPGRIDVERIAGLRPAFDPQGTITAANASKIADGAAAVVIGNGQWLDRQKPLARIAGYTSFAREPERFTLAPVGAMERLLQQVGWDRKDVDLWEINEAFAVVTLAAIQQMDLDPERVNVHGGACALGHPLGATGARIVVTLVHALHQHGLKRGIASLCIGGGEATAIAIERL